MGNKRPWAQPRVSGLSEHLCKPYRPAGREDGDRTLAALLHMRRLNSEKCEDQRVPERLPRANPITGLEQFCLATLILSLGFSCAVELVWAGWGWWWGGGGGVLDARGQCRGDPTHITFGFEGALG